MGRVAAESFAAREGVVPSAPAYVMGASPLGVARAHLRTNT